MSAKRVLTALLFALASGAEAEGLFLAGTEMRREGERYVFAGVLLPLPGASRLDKGWIQRYWADESRYRYDIGAPPPQGEQRIDARVAGAEAALGYRFSGSHWTVAGFAGLRYEHVRTDPLDPGSRILGSNVRPRFQFEADTSPWLSWHLRTIAAYTFGRDAYWLRSQFLHALGSGAEVGPEIVLLGDPDYRATKVGLAITRIPLSPGLSVGFRAGYHLQTRAGSPYVGAEVAILF